MLCGYLVLCITPGFPTFLPQNLVGRRSTDLEQCCAGMWILKTPGSQIFLNRTRCGKKGSGSRAIVIRLFDFDNNPRFSFLGTFLSERIAGFAKIFEN